MNIGFCKILVLVAFGMLQAHNFIPHHHHHRVPSHLNVTGHDEEDHHHHHHHHHLPIFDLHIDEFFFANTFQIHSGITAAIVPVFNSFPENNISQISHQVFGEGYLRDHPPLPPFLSTFSFRGPPAV